MVTRRVYYLCDNKIRYKDFNIKWNGGFSIQQKRKNIDELHRLIANYFQIDKKNILEISTKSNTKIGFDLSSFNLLIKYNGSEYPLESIYQSSKVFSDLFKEYQVLEVLKMNPKNAKTRLSLEDHSKLVKFRFLDKDYPLKPINLFYDWLYINAVKQIPNLYSKLESFNYFTDIEFNPQRSLSCQAGAIVLYLNLIKNNELDAYVHDPKCFYADEG